MTGGAAGTSGQGGMGTGTGLAAMSAYSGQTAITGGNSLSGLDAIFIKDLPENLAAIVDCIRRLDVQPLQILIEAVILRVELTERQKLGVDFAAVNKMANMAIVSGDALRLNTATGISARVLSPVAPYSPRPRVTSILGIVPASSWPAFSRLMRMTSASGSAIAAGTSRSSSRRSRR